MVIISLGRYQAYHNCWRNNLLLLCSENIFGLSFEPILPLTHYFRFCRRHSISEENIFCEKKTCYCWLLPFMPRRQCDQIWWKFTSVTKFLKSMALYWRPNSIWQHFEHILTNYLCFWANINDCKWPNIEHLIKPSGHTGRALSPLLFLSTVALDFYE